MKCHMAKYLSCIFSDSTNHLYFFLLKSILQEVNATNKFFQISEQDVAEYYQALWTFIMSVASRIIKPAFLEKARTTECISDIARTLTNELALVSAKTTDYFLEFETLASKCNLKLEEVQNVRVRCHEYLPVLYSELIKRMPTHFSILKMTSKFSPTRLLSVLQPVSIADLPVKLINVDANIGKLENQLRQIRFVDWVRQFGLDNVQNTISFWSRIMSAKDAGGNQPFNELSEFVLKILSLPLSNAVVERVFSIRNAVKTKTRNKIQLDMLEALLRIRTNFFVTKTCSNSFQPSTKMFELFTAKMYEYQTLHSQCVGEK